jgi:hypothetical protein
VEQGVWRIPVSEIDRPGSFASHMSRCVLLLMEVLREVRDHRMLLELCLQLRRTPEADKLVYQGSNSYVCWQFLVYFTSLLMQNYVFVCSDICKLHVCHF